MDKEEQDRDCRKLNPKQQEEIRRRAVAAVLDGQSPEDVADAFGVSRASVYLWLAKYNAGGWPALETRRRSGRPAKVTPKMLRWIFRAVSTKNPLQFEFKFALWTRKIIRDLIKRRFGLYLSEDTVGRMLKRLGLSVQRPLWRAWQQDPEKVENWKHTEYPEIRREAKRLGAKIFFADEAGMRSDCHAGTTWGIRGETPVVKATGARFSTNMISAVSPAGELRFMVVDGSVNAGVFCEFLDRLMHGEDGHVFLVVDGHPSHKARKVKAHLEKFEGRLRLFFLPPYSPELNPDEWVWCWVKSHNVGKQVCSDKTEMKELIRSALRSLQKSINTILGFFRAPDLQYI